IEIPCFQSLESIRGNWNEIEARINELKNESSLAWLEIVYQSDEVIGNLRNRLDELIAGTGIEILRTQNNRIVDRVLNRIHEEETLDSLNVDEVFDRCLAAHEIPDEQKIILRNTYREAVMSLHNIDPLAE
ncbi:MAG: exonuclease SbcCD subunit D C-terminal domain-containing protein, partial [Victivallaceae bacterium]